MGGIYLDNNSTAPLRPEAREALVSALEQLGGNPSSLHGPGRTARHLLDEAREQVAGALGVHEDAVLFTASGTEANNLALFGVLEAAGPGSGLVTTAIEHSSVLAAAVALEKRGHRLARVGVDSEARVAAEEVVSAAAAAGTALVSVQAANNEVGSVAPLGAIAEGLAGLPASQRPLLHTDAVQALGRLPLELRSGGVDLASFSAHKVGAPIGVGVLVRSPGVKLSPHLHGGGQEAGLRPGTENVAGIVAAARAIEIAVNEREEFAARTSRLACGLWEALSARVPGARLLGGLPRGAHRLGNTLNIVLPDTDGRVLVTRLDLEGLHVSSGSACASGSLEASHVLLAMGLDEREARAGLRISLGWNTDEDDCKRAVDILTKVSGPSHAT